MALQACEQAPCDLVFVDGAAVSIERLIDLRHHCGCAASAPEDLGWFSNIRAQCATPLAMGELFNSPHEWVPLITGGLIDYMRMHFSQTGGITPCRKVAAMGEIFNVRTA